MLTITWWRRRRKSGPVLQTISPEQHRWVVETFKGAWSLQTVDPAVFGGEPEWNIWAYVGEHRLSFHAEADGLHVNVAMGYRRPGPPRCHQAFTLRSADERARFLAWLPGV